MRRIHRKLTQERYSEFFARLSWAGCPLDVAQAPVEANGTLRIRQGGGVAENMVLSLQPAGTGYILDLVIATPRSIVTIDDFELLLPWDDPQIRWLDDPVESSGHEQPYRIPGGNGPEFPHDIVLNHRRKVRRGSPISGFLLGFGRAPIPKEFAQGTLVEAILRVTDELGNSSTASVSFSVARWAGRIRKTTVKSVGRLFTDDAPQTRSHEIPPALRISTTDATKGRR